MAKHIAGIDHMIVGVRDLKAAKAGYERLGFRTTPLGRHVGWGTANHCIMFERDYLELLGIVDPKQFTNQLDTFLEDGEGLMSIALGTPDPEATHAAWTAATLQPAAIAELGRRIEPDLELRFKNVMVPGEATGGVRLFGCAALTPERMRRPDWLIHPNGAVAISSVTVVVENPADFFDPMAKVFGETALTETDDTLAVHTGRGVLLFATPDDLLMLHPQLRSVLEGDAPRLAVLTLRVQDLEATAAWLRNAGIGFQRQASGAIGLSATLANGVLLEFAS
jgi:catechol 2,3-dioxygenase-like lactoylglutathione lyase family enzyme